jgi:hypothetical protein
MAIGGPQVNSCFQNYLQRREVCGRWLKTTSVIGKQQFQIEVLWW